MASYFIFGAVAQCPHCGDHRFSGPATLTPEATVTCHKCGQACTVAVAVTTALESGVVKKLSDHRVVGDR
jgi:transcription elongation factor Elf1